MAVYPPCLSKRRRAAAGSSEAWLGRVIHITLIQISEDSLNIRR
jgi:hypothetical protein